MEYFLKTLLIMTAVDRYTWRITIKMYIILLVCLGYIISKVIAYFYCPLDRGKTSLLLLLHFVISLAFAVVFFLLLEKGIPINLSFYDQINAIGVFLLFWFIGILLIGLIIERILTATDVDYKAWKKEYLS